MTAPLTLFHVPDWGSSIIRLVLEEIGAPHEVRLMDWDAGDFDSPAFRAINPLGLIPALDTPEGPIFETAAILLWLNERFGGLGPREGEPDRLAFLSWLFFVANTLHPTVLALVYPDRAGGPEAAPAVQRLAFERLNTQAAQLETLITTRNPTWLSTEKPGAIGHYLGMLLRWAICQPEDPQLRFSLRPFPAVKAVLAAHESSPAAQRAILADALGPHPFTAPKVAPT